MALWFVDNLVELPCYYGDMAEKLISKRVAFPKGEQRKFMEEVIDKISIREAANLCSVSPRTVRDWRREKFLIDYTALTILCKKLTIPLPTNIKLRDRYWYGLKGASAGGKALIAKYGRVGGDPEHRKIKWREWWEQTGRSKYHPIINQPLPIQKPQKSEKLAEFTGITMGDGGISNYQVTITLHRRDDKEFAFYVRGLIKELFGVEPKMYDSVKNSVIDVVVSRTELVKFCTQELGLPLGNKVKQQFDIPSWVKSNKKYKVACLRGLVDTDGCVFTHTYKVNQKWYSYKKLSFTSRSQPLLQSVHTILCGLGLSPRLTNLVDVRLDSAKDMQKYFKIIGTHNPKHWKNYKE